MAYLVKNPPRRSQFRSSRRAKPTGTIVLHSAENTPDLVGADSGAENVAAFIRNRSDAGSYHLLGDRDSVIHLVPFEYEAYHDGTGSNPWSIGISIALTAQWFRTSTDEQKLWYMAQLATMARTASDWLEANHGITVPARRLTKATYNQPGFCTHMDRETWHGTPGRRSDPWGNSDAMWSLFLELYEDTARTRPTPTPAPAPAPHTPIPNTPTSTENEDMLIVLLQRAKGTAMDYYVLHGGKLGHLATMADVHALARAGVPIHDKPLSRETSVAWRKAFK